MSTAGEQGGLGKYIVVYLCMLAVTGIEVAIAGSNPGGAHLLPIMLILAFAGALLGVLFFMGLAAEKRSLILFVAVFTLFVMATINYGWTDSFRVLMGVPYAK
jgi:heme/copper-type cytochrome/quinol oxidase subunit 4